MVFNRFLYYLTSESTVSCISTKRPENEVSEENETVNSYINNISISKDEQ